MAIPSKATGYGNNSVAQNVFAFKVSQALSSLIKYEVYDNDQTFPTVDTVTTTANDVIAGTTMNGSVPMISLVDTTNAAPVKDWKPWAVTAGEANPNRMKGQVNYVEQDGSNLGANGRATYNMVAEVPSDATTAMAMGFDVLFRYTYTGTAPTITLEYNEGTEGVPTWTAMTAGTHGIKHCRAGVSSPDLFANIPATGFVSTAFQSVGSGLDDLTAGGTHSAATRSKFEVEIDATGAPDTFKWRKNEGTYTTGVSITGSAQTLSDDVTVTFAATTGHTLADEWTIYCDVEDTAEGWATT